MGLYLKLSQKYCFMVLGRAMLEVLRGFEAVIVESHKETKE